nr:homeodomain-like protein [Tanacetum cinerariifolium]
MNFLSFSKRKDISLEDNHIHITFRGKDSIGHRFIRNGNIGTPDDSDLDNSLWVDILDQTYAYVSYDDVIPHGHDGGEVELLYLIRMTKVIKGEFEKLKDLKVKDVSLTYDTSLKVFDNEFNRMSRMDDDLFTYEVEVANIPCDSNKEDDSKQRTSHEADDDTGYDPSDVAFTEWLGSKKINYRMMDQYTKNALWIYWFRGDDEVELTDEDFSDNEDDVAKVFRIDANIFNFETPMCKAFNEFNYLLQIDPDLLTKDIMGSLDPFFEDYIELNDLNEPFELRINQGDGLMPTIEEGKDKMKYKGNNVVGTLMNIPIFVGTISILTDFAVLEDMDAYCEEGMGDVIFGEPFLREVRIKTRWFEGMITIYNGNDEVTYQMVRSHPRFKHHTNEQCNKILPLLKVSEEDMVNGISHPYQKLKVFYKGVLNLGPDYIRNAKMEEWLKRGHISVYEMK